MVTPWPTCVEQQERIRHFHSFSFLLELFYTSTSRKGRDMLDSNRRTHLATQITPMCSLLLMKGKVSTYKRLGFRNIYMGSMEKWQRSKLLITKNNKKGHCNTVSQTEMGFHSDCSGTLHLEMHWAKLFTNNLTVHYCLQCRNELAKNWQKKKKVSSLMSSCRIPD